VIVVSVDDKCDRPFSGLSDARIDWRLDFFCPAAAATCAQYEANGETVFFRTGELTEDKEWRWLLEPRGIWHDRKDLRGARLKAAAGDYLPYLSVKVDESAEIDEESRLLAVEAASGAFAVAVDMLQMRMNFTADLVTREDGAWGMVKQK